MAMTIDVVEYGTEYVLVFPAWDPSNPEAFATGVTMASGDTKISTDNGANYSNTTNTPSFANGAITVTITATELQDDRLLVKLEDQDGPAFADDLIELRTKGNASAFYGVDVATNSSGEVTVDDLSTTAKASVNAEVDTAIGDASLATAAALATVDSNVDAILTDTGTTLDDKINTLDTLVDAIKAKTDSLTFTVSGEVDSNVQSVNDNALTGGGASAADYA